MKHQYKLLLGIFLLIIAFCASILLQQTGYLTYLNGDMASETILAHKQAVDHHLIERDWIYSTEIHTLHMNLFYAIAFFFVRSYKAARIVGNTIVFFLSVFSFISLGRKLRWPLSRSLILGALLPVGISTLYAQNFTIGGYYIIHLPLAYLLASFWLSATDHASSPASVIIFLMLCILEGFLSVRYVLCFICPIALCCLFRFLMKKDNKERSPLKPDRSEGITFLGFFSALIGYLFAEWVTPRFFQSGVGAASTFQFKALSGQDLSDTLLTIGTDFLKLMGWRNQAKLFSLGGIINLSILAVLVLGTIILVYCLRHFSVLSANEQKIVQLALYALSVNLIVFLFLDGTYLNRYLILAFIFFLPMLGILLQHIPYPRLNILFILVLILQTSGSSLLLFQETATQEKEHLAQEHNKVEVLSFLSESGYKHGYGSFWNVRILEELSDGSITFTGIRPEETEEGAVVACVPEFIRWLEPISASALDVTPEKTFLILTPPEEESLRAFLAFSQASKLFENSEYRIYGFESSESFATYALLGKMKLTNAEYSQGIYTIRSGGRMRIPTSWREQGKYALRFDCQNASCSILKVYRTSRFEVLKEHILINGVNTIVFETPSDDKYFMILFENPGTETIQISNIHLSKLELQ